MNTTRRDFLKTIGAITGSGAALQASASETETGRSQRPPNILFFFPDQHRFDWIGTTPEIPVRTPFLDALGQRGVRFTQAICPSPLCAPARACIAAGKEYTRCRVPSNGTDYPLDQTTIYTLLRNTGYHTTGCGKFDLHKASATWGLDGKHLVDEWGFSDGIDNAGKWDAYNSGAEVPKDPYMAFLYQKEWAKIHLDDFKKRRKKSYEGTFPTPLAEEGYCDNWIGQNGLRLLEKVPKGKPWFLQVNLTGPHAPMDITRRMDKHCRDHDFPQPNRSTQFDAKIHNAIRQNYSAMVENIDRWLGLYIEALEKRGELENTLIVFSSDHGEMLGDHNLWGKSKPHQPSIGVPLTIAGPGVQPGIVSDALVTTMDLAATFLEYGNISIPSDMDSRSLGSLMQGKQKTHREAIFSGLGKWRTVFDGQYKLVTGYGKTGEPRLFDMLADPLENDDIAGKDAGRVKRMMELLS